MNTSYRDMDSNNLFGLHVNTYPHTLFLKNDISFDSMNENQPSPRDKDYLLAILISLELIYERTKGYSYEEHLNNWLISDSVMFRIELIEEVMGEISEYIKNEIIQESEKSVSMFLNLLKRKGIPYDEIYNVFIKGKKTEDSDLIYSGTFEDIYDTVERVYFKFYEPESYHKKPPKNESNKKISLELCTDYPYSTKSSKSIWTVKKR
jgi:hypothetical protein